MWVLDGSLQGDATTDIQLHEKSSNSSLARWAEELASMEAQRLNALGLRTLPLKVHNCGPLSMIQTGKTLKDKRRIVFNRVNISTTFDFGKVTSVEIGSFDEDTFTSPDGMMHFCTICLLRIGRGKSMSPCVDGKEMVLILPYVFDDPRNPLTHWAFVNSKEEAHYIVRTNVRQGSNVVPGQKPLPETAADQQPDKTVKSDQDGDLAHEKLCEERRSSACNTKLTPIERIRNEWGTYSAAQQADLVTFADDKIFELALGGVSSLLDGKMGTTSDIVEHLRNFPMLSVLEFEHKCNGQKIMSLSCTLLQDTVAFFALLQQLCPKPFTGKLRPRRDPCMWSSLLEPPAQDLAELQQMIAQLVEQKLWVLADVGASEQHAANTKAGKRRRRRTQTLAAKQEAHVAASGTPEAPSSETEEVSQKCFDEPCQATSRLPDFDCSASASMADPATEAAEKTGPQLFRQPPGLEIDDASLVQRLILRSWQLEQQLAEARAKTPITQLLSNSLVGA